MYNFNSSKTFFICSITSSSPLAKSNKNESYVYKTNFVFDAGDWEWCPIHKGTDKQFICQKSITPMQVFIKAKQLLTSKK